MKERSLVENVKHAQGRYGGFCFGGAMPDGATPADPLPPGTVFPNGARAALLLTFDVEGTYGNGAGNMEREITNYCRICERLVRHGIPATFNVVGQMAEEQGPEFIKSMWDAGCEVAPHGYVHDMNKRYGGDAVYAGHYGPEENRAQVRDGIAAIEAIRPGSVKGFRLPYGHFNEYSYDAFEEAGLLWTSNVGIDDFTVPGQGFAPAPFRMQLGDKVYPMVEIPLDSQTCDWCIWIADEQANAPFVNSVRAYCDSRRIPFERTPRGGVAVCDRRPRLVSNSVHREAMPRLDAGPTESRKGRQRIAPGGNPGTTNHKKDPVPQGTTETTSLPRKFDRCGTMRVGVVSNSVHREAMPRLDAGPPESRKGRQRIAPGGNPGTTNHKKDRVP